MGEEIRTKILERKLIAILRGLSPEEYRRTAQALFDGGVRFLEITFDPGGADAEKTLRAIRLLTSEFDGEVCPGAGTVLRPEQVDLAAAAGAKYIISPNCSEAVIRRTKELGLLSMPGAFTPTEIARAAELGADFVKVFPAVSAGPEYIKAIRAPLRHIPMLAVGGVDLGNLRAFLDAGCAGAGVGGCLVDRALIRAGKYEELTELARRFCDAAEGGNDK